MSSDNVKKCGYCFEGKVISNSDQNGTANDYQMIAPRFEIITFLRPTMTSQWFECGLFLRIDIIWGLVIYSFKTSVCEIPVHLQPIHQNIFLNPAWHLRFIWSAEMSFVWSVTFIRPVVRNLEGCHFVNNLTPNEKATYYMLC